MVCRLLLFIALSPCRLGEMRGGGGGGGGGVGGGVASGGVSQEPFIVLFSWAPTVPLHPVSSPDSSLAGPSLVWGPNNAKAEPGGALGEVRKSR